MNEILGNCDVCGQQMSNDNSNIHHLIPQLKGGRTGPTIRLHTYCHSKIHSIWNENELRDVYNDMSIIMDDDRMKSFAKWVRKQKDGIKISNKMTNTHKRKRKR